MKLSIKLKNAEYTMHMDTSSMTVDCTQIGKGKDGAVKEITSTLGYFGPAQVDIAVSRIVNQEITLDEERVGLKEFLRRYKAIADSVNEQVLELKKEVVESRKAGRDG